MTIDDWMKAAERELRQMRHLMRAVNYHIAIQDELQNDLRKLVGRQAETAKAVLGQLDQLSDLSSSRSSPQR